MCAATKATMYDTLMLDGSHRKGGESVNAV
jgi:hypothetical protein